MTIRSVTIYKTPLDNSYSNVVDFINTERHRQDVLFFLFDKSYSHRAFQGIGRSIKRVGNSTLIVLPITYEEGRNYNYMIIEDDLQRLYFYFITNIISENESSTNPSSTFTLEWDVWNNNIENFKDINNVITKKHYDRVNQIGSSRIPNFLVQFSNIDIPKSYKEIKLGDRYKPLFAAITLSEINVIKTFSMANPLPVLDMEYASSTVNDTKMTRVIISDWVSNRYNKHIIYVLVGMLDSENNRYVSFQTYGAAAEYTGGDNKYYSYVRRFNYDPITELYIPNSLTPYINDIQFTFHVPYEYEISTDNGLELSFPNNPLFDLSIGYYQGLAIIGGDYIIYDTDHSTRFFTGSF